MPTVSETIKAIEATRPRSKWQQGVKQTALDMLDGTVRRTVDENIQAVLKEIKARPALLTAYLSAVINATDLPDPRRMDSLF